MKKIILTILTVVIFTSLSVKCYAKEYTGSSEDSTDIYDYKEYLPNEVLEILNQNGGQAIENINISFIFETVYEYVFSALEKYSVVITELLALVIVLSILLKLIDNNGLLLIIRFMFFGICGALLFGIFKDIHIISEKNLASVSEIFTVTLPAFTTILIMGGAPITGGQAAASIGAVTVCLEAVLSNLGLTLAVLTFIFIILEKISPVFESAGCAKSLKKYSVMLITFICTVLLTVLSFQTLLSARADSLTTRSVKFAAANFIPIVGNAVGESLRTVGYGVDYLKSSVGGSVSLAIFFTVFPVLSELFIIKLSVSFLSFISSLCGVGNECNILSLFVEVIDIVLVIIICCLILSILMVIILTNSIMFG